MKYKTLVDNPWSKKGEVVKAGKLYFTATVENVSKLKYLHPHSPADYPSIWEPIEEEKKEISDEELTSMAHFLDSEESVISLIHKGEDLYCRYLESLKQEPEYERTPSDVATFAIIGGLFQQERLSRSLTERVKRLEEK